MIKHILLFGLLLLLHQLSAQINPKYFEIVDDTVEKYFPEYDQTVLAPIKGIRNKT